MTIERIVEEAESVIFLSLVGQDDSGCIAAFVLESNRQGCLRRGFYSIAPMIPEPVQCSLMEL